MQLIDEDGVRATQTGDFSLTQSIIPGSMGSLDLSLLGSNTQTQSTMIFSVGSMGLTSHRLTSHGSQTPESKYAKMRRRLTKNSDAVQTLMIKQAELKRKRDETVQRLRVEQRQKKVSVYREYRLGELPDVEIKNSEVTKKKTIIVYLFSLFIYAR